MLLALLAVAASAQDPELEPLLLLARQAEPAADVEASSLQFFHLPLGTTLRDRQDHPWGLRITLPLSFGIYDFDAASDLGSLSERLETLTITPGLEFQIPAGKRWLIKPFGKIGLATGFRGEAAELLFSLGLRTRGDWDFRRGHFTLGIAGRWTDSRSSRTRIADYTTLEAGADTQLEIGHLGGRLARAGVYAIARFFPDLELVGTTSRSLDVDRIWELGLSFSTEPALRIWRLELPWIAVGYRFGDLFEGVRVSFSFPF